MKEKTKPESRAVKLNSTHFGYEHAKQKKTLIGEAKQRQILLEVEEKSDNGLEVMQARFLPGIL